MLRSFIGAFWVHLLDFILNPALHCGSLSARVDSRHGYALLFVESLLRKFSQRLHGAEKCVLTFCFLKAYRIC